jgi:hypothetical protein
MSSGIDDLQPGDDPRGFVRMSGASSPDRKILPVVIATAVAALMFEAFALSASRIWFTPDSTAYITLAVEIAERFDFSHELLQHRLPGYPCLLAAVFALFGDASPAAILVIQHAMVAGCAVLSVLIAWTLRPRIGFAAIVGLFSAASLHLSGYANAILTEVPYTFMLTVCVYLLVRHYVRGGLGSLVGASLAAVVATLIKDIGQLMVLACAVTALLRAWQATGRSIPAGVGGLVQRVPIGYRLKQTGVACVSAIAPAAALLLPLLLHNYRTHGYLQPTCNTGLLLYHRAGCMEGLDSDSSEAVAQIRDAVEQAKQRGWLKPNATHHDYLSAVLACQRMYDTSSPIFASSSLSEVTELMSRAGRDLMLEHPWTILRRTVLYSYRAFVMPDDGYRLQPGAPGDENRLPSGAVLHAVDTYLPSVAQRVGEQTLAGYLPVSNKPTTTTPLWSNITTWYHGRIEKGSPITGLFDTPYEEYAALSALGMLLSLSLRHRVGWGLLWFVILYHVVGSAFYGGVQPRYTVPMHPFLHVLAALPIVLGARAVAAGLRAICVRSSAGAQAAVSLKHDV